MLKRNMSLKGALGVFIIITFLYYVFINFETHGIMDEFRNVINDIDGTYKVENEKLLVFRPGDGHRIVVVKRYFTWCWRGKGRIWLYKNAKHVSEKGKIIDVPDYFSINIEKKDGKWLVTRLNIQP